MNIYKLGLALSKNTNPNVNQAVPYILYSINSNEAIADEASFYLKNLVYLINEQDEEIKSLSERNESLLKTIQDLEEESPLPNHQVED